MAAPRNIIDQQGTFWPMVRLVLPVFAEQWLYMLVGLCDTWFTGRFLTTPHLAAISLMAYVLWMLTDLAMFVGIGATAMIARFHGARQEEQAVRVANQCYLLGLVFAGMLTVILWVLRDKFSAAMQLDPEAAMLANRYLTWIIPAVPFLLINQIGVAALRGAGDMMAGLKSMTLVNVVNISISGSLLLGWGPFPKLGWDGLAIGTVSGQVAGGCLVTWWLIRGRAGLKLSVSAMRPDRELIRRILRIGVPGGFDHLLIVVSHMAYLAIINRLGDLPAAAHGVAVRIESLSYLPGSAFQLAVMTLVGQYLGAEDHRRAARSVAMTCLTGGGFMLLAASFFYFGSNLASGWMVHADQVAVIDLAGQLLRIVAIGTLPMGITMILLGALRGAGDTRWAFVVNTIGLLAFRLPLAWFLAHTLGWGVKGAYFAMITDLSVRACLVLARFFQGGWKHIRV